MEDVLALPLNQLDIGINKRVISLPSKASVLDAMKLMHEQGVSSIAVIDTDGSLLSVCANLSSMVQMGFVSNRVPQAVSVTDIGRLVATSPDRSVLSVSLAHFISLIKASCTSEPCHARSHIRCSSHRAPQTAKIDIPCIVSLNRHNLAMLSSCCWQVCATILSVVHARLQIYLLVANSHRLFITSTPPTTNSNASPATSPALLPPVVPATAGQGSAALSSSIPSSAQPIPLSTPSTDLKMSTSSSSLSSFPTRSAEQLTPAPYGVISFVDVLAVFARLAGLQDVDPNTVRKHRRHSSAALSSGSADGGGGSGRSTPSPTVSRLRGYSTSSDSRIR